MAIISGTIRTGLPDKFNSNKLAAELDALGPVGWKLILDDPDAVHVYYEFDESTGLKKGQVEAAFKAHRLAANEDDDQAAFEKQQLAKRGIEQRVSDIEARLAVLESK